MLGAFWLGRFGWIDLAQVYVPDTYLLPQLAGGLIFGAGFAQGWPVYPTATDGR